MRQQPWGLGLLWVCPSCGSGHLPAQPADSTYGNEYFDGQGGVDYEGSKRQMQLINHSRLDFIEQAGRPLAGRRSMDLGCALGFFMEAAEERGAQAWGVEISGFAAGKARQRFGERVKQGPWQDTPEDWKDFDLVSAFHVMEHLDNPGAALDRAFSMLKAGGLLAIEVPDFSSRKAQQGRDAWQYFLPGEHLQYFTRPGLRQLLGQHGFVVLAEKRVSFTRLLGGMDKAGLKGLKDLILRYLKWLAWIKKLVLALRGLLGGHDCILILARKPEGGAL